MVKHITQSGTRRLVILSMLAASGLVIFVFESFLPLLWFRPGLGNIATILALLLFGFGDSMKVTLLRVVLGALVLGRLFTPLFFFALTGGIASTLVMAAVFRSGKLFGPVGISVLGAVAHNIVQVAVAFLFVRSGELFIFLPVYVLAGVATGTLTGIVSAMIYERVRERGGLVFS